LCIAPGCNAIAISHKGECAAHAERHHACYSDRPMPSRRSRNPIGIELEYVGEHVWSLARTVSSDGSIQGDGGEVKLLASDRRIIDVASDTAQRARIAGCETNESCGLHVHLSMARGLRRCGSRAVIGADERVIDGAADRIAMAGRSMQDRLFAAMPRSRRGNSYVRPIAVSDQLTDHYSWLSLSSRVPTIEIRMHASSVNPWKVRGWIEWTLYLRQYLTAVILGEVEPTITVPSALAPVGSLAHTYMAAREASPILSRFVF